MTKKKNFTILGIIIVLAFLAGNLAEPKYFNQGVDSLNTKFDLQLPHFWAKPFKLGLDLQGGTRLVYEADLSQIEKKDYNSSMQGLRDVIERRVNLFGVREPIVQTQEAGEHRRLIIELAGVKDPEEAIKEIGKTPFLEFKKPKENFEEIIEKQRELMGKTEEEVQQIENWELALEDPFESTSLTGKYLEKAEIGFHSATNEPMVLIQFNKEGAKIFGELTEQYVGQPLAIYIDGIRISSPTVQEKISGGSAQITGGFSIDEARELARNLNAGALPVPISLISQKTIGPTLGALSVQESLRAGMLGFLAIILFLIFFYRLSGVLASLALMVYVLLILALFKFISVTLTLAGIGGFILSIGMAVDANILIFSRIKEELEKDRTFSTSIEEGFRRAWPSIRDGNMTTLIVAVILFSFGTSFIKGFALTLSVGILLSMLSAIFVTKTFLRCFAFTRLGSCKWLWR